MKKLVLLPMLLALLVVASVAMAAQPGSEVRGHGKVQIGDPLRCQSARSSLTPGRTQMASTGRWSGLAALAPNAVRRLFPGTWM